MTIQRPFASWGVTIDATNNVIPLTFGGVDYNPAIAPGFVMSAHQLNANIDAALEALGLGGTWSVVFSGTNGRTTIAHSTTNFSLRWGTGSNTLAGILGFNAANTSGSARTYTGSIHTQGCWVSPVPARIDSRPIRNRPLDVVTRSVAGQTKTIRDAEYKTREVTFSALQPEHVFIAREDGSTINRAIERWWQAGATGAGAHFNFWPYVSSTAHQISAVFDEATLRRFEPKRMKTMRELYEVSFSFIEYT